MALCAAALCFPAYIWLHTQKINEALLFFLFAATLLSYNVHFFLASLKSGSSVQLQWFQKQKLFTIVFNFASLVFTGFLFFQLSSLYVFIIALIILNAAYTAPLLFKKALQLPVAFTFIKSYFNGFTWAFATVVLPVITVNEKPGITELAIFIHRFLLVSIATLIFDYRDKLRDLELGVHTPANKMKEHPFHWFFIANILVFIAAVLWLNLTISSGWQWLQFIPCFYLWWLYLQSKKGKMICFICAWWMGPYSFQQHSVYSCLFNYIC
ncbi:MAG: hypothetical protein K2X48_00640 [Chitinophagaceae bacterium]|nr:hypothetical protein [Chitinophagaceae bacterium]